MTKYLNPELVFNSFKRLSSRESSGKTHLERTSALMYFLAIDATCKHFDVNSLDLNPYTPDGQRNRKHVELEFTKLVLVEKSRDSLKQVIELGNINEGGTKPEKRISSNFFTVPLKRASNQKEPFYYPRRPAPLLKMGPSATIHKWGVDYHENWSSNFPKFLSESKGGTPILDLIIFICRDCQFDNASNDIYSVICEQLKTRFTKKMAGYLILEMNRQKFLAHHVVQPFINKYLSFANIYKDDMSTLNSYIRMNKSDLIDYILRLESILNENKIKY